MTNIEVLKMDGCTEREAEKHLNRGTLVLDDFEENFDKYMEEWDYDEEEKETCKNMITTGDPVADWGVVKLKGKTYYIQYIL